MTAEPHLTDEATLRAITDPRERLRQATATANQAKELAHPHRVRRNAAAILMLRTGQVHAVEVWDQTIGLSRTRWNRVTADANTARVPELRAEAEELQQRIDRTPIDQTSEITRLGKERAAVERELQRIRFFLAAVDELADELHLSTATPAEALQVTREVARAEAEATNRYDQVAAAAQEVARETMVGLCEGSFGGVVLSNTEVGRIAGLTQGRVSQLRRAAFSR